MYIFPSDSLYFIYFTEEYKFIDMRRIIILCIFIVLMISCNNDKDKPDASFKIFAGNIERTDSIPVNTDGYVLFTGYADEGRIVFFTGSGRSHNRYSDQSDTGASINADKKVFFRYTNKDEKDTIVCLATVVKSSKEYKRDVKQKVVTIY
jgi:hypothetical protein